MNITISNIFDTVTIWYENGGLNFDRYSPGDPNPLIHRNTLMGTMLETNLLLGNLIYWYVEKDKSYFITSLIKSYQNHDILSLNKKITKVDLDRYLHINSMSQKILHNIFLGGGNDDFTVVSRVKFPVPSKEVVRQFYEKYKDRITVRYESGPTEIKAHLAVYITPDRLPSGSLDMQIENAKTKMWLPLTVVLDYINLHDK